MAEGRSAAVAQVGAASWGRVVAVGLAGGLLAGLFGVGGGLIMVPLLVAWTRIDQRRASATSLLAIVPIAVAAATGYAGTGSLDARVGLVLLAGGVLGGQLGAWLLPRTSIARLQLWFGVLSLATAVRLVLDEGTGAAAGALVDTGTAGGVLLMIGVGIAAGILAGLLGVGGGVIMVPALVILAGASADVARGTSLVVVIGTALTATVANARRHLVEVRSGLVAGAAGAPAGLVGAALGQWLPGRAALALFAVLLAWSGVRMIRRSRAPAVR